jgi:hypothetical protein
MELTVSPSIREKIREELGLLLAKTETFGDLFTKAHPIPMKGRSAERSSQQDRQEKGKTTHPDACKDVQIRPRVHDALERRQDSLNKIRAIKEFAHTSELALRSFDHLHQFVPDAFARDRF